MWFIGLLVQPSHSLQQLCNQKAHIQKCVNEPPFKTEDQHPPEVGKYDCKPRYYHDEISIIVRSTMVRKVLLLARAMKLLDHLDILNKFAYTLHIPNHHWVWTGNCIDYLQVFVLEKWWLASLNRHSCVWQRWEYSTGREYSTITIHLFIGFPRCPNS